MAVIAITRILHGVKGETKEIGIGDELTGFSEDELRGLVENGSAVEVGKDRKFTTAPNPAAPADEETRKRDELLAKAASGVEGDLDVTSASPGVANAAGSPAAQTGGATTIQQVASDSQKS